MCRRIWHASGGGCHTREHLKEFFRNNIYSHIPDNNWKTGPQSPRGRWCWDNANGMAPGLILEKEGKTAILLPGPPNELYPMFNGQVFPYLQQKQNAVLVSSMVKICGYGESQVEDMLLDLIDAPDKSHHCHLAKTAEVHLRITARAGSRKEGWPSLRLWRRR